MKGGKKQQQNPKTREAEKTVWNWEPMNGIISIWQTPSEDTDEMKEARHKRSHTV